MLCDSCQSQEATVHYKEVCDGAVAESHLCEQCARAQGLPLDQKLPLTDFLFGVGAGSAAFRPDTSPAGASACPFCGMTQEKLRKHSRFGCSECYIVFADDVARMVRELQRDDSHRGKTVFSLSVEALQAAIERAVQCEDFEYAAVLRNRMTRLQEPVAHPVAG